MSHFGKGSLIFFCRVRLRLTCVTVMMALLYFVGATPLLAQSKKPTKDTPDLRAGPPIALASGGPDAFGYRWIDSDDFDGPVFNWQDISGVGTAVFLTDDDSVEVALPFAFPFYGAYHTSVRISSNGYLTFDPEATEYFNAAIPTAAAPNNIIAPFWDDLDPSGGVPIHYYYDAVADEFIVQYTNIPHYAAGGPYTFQVKLQPGGSIIFQYLTMGQPVNSATVGIENAAGTTGLQVAFNAAYLHDNLAIHLDWKRRVPDAYKRIQVAIDATVAGDTVLVGPGTYTGALNKDLTFDGKDIVVMSEAGALSTIIDCQKSGRGFIFSNGESNAAVVDGFWIINGSQTDGGAIYLNFSHPTIRNCLLTTNIAGGNGGGIYMNSSNPILSFCYVGFNLADFGGGLYIRSSAPTILSCIVEGDSATTSGGGLYYTASSGGLLGASIVNDNHSNASTGNGGGVDINGSAPIIAGTSFTLNTANTGGGVHAWAGATPYFAGCTIGDNVAALSGGGLDIASNATIDSCTISGNTVGGAGGAGVYVNGAVTLTNCTITGNVTTSDGGGIKINTGNPNITGCTVAGNQAANGGGIQTEEGTGTISNCLITGNVATSGGGGVWSTFTSVPVYLGCTIASNYAGSQGGGIRADQQNPVSLDRTIVWGNCAGSSGDEVYAADAVTLSFTCSTVDTSGVEGSGNTNYDNNTIFADPLFCAATLCSATPSTEGEYTLDDDSPCLATASPCMEQIGALGEKCNGRVFDVVEDGFPTIQAAIDETVSDVGDTVLVADSTWTGMGNTALDFKGKNIVVKSKNGPTSAIIDCQNAVRGAIFQTGEDTTAVFEGFGITNGNQALPGCAILIQNSSPTILDCVVYSNTADAGVIRVNSGSPTLETCGAELNTSTSQDGVFALVDGFTRVIDCVIQDNTAANAVSVTSASLFADGVLLENSGVGIRFASSSPSTVTGTVFATQGGRGVVLDATSVSFVGAQFEDNGGGGAVVTGLVGVAAATAGGDRSAAASVSNTFVDCEFSGNTAARGAGFLFDCDNDPLLPYTLVFDNCRFTGNHASLDGGGVAVCGHATNTDIIPYFANCTISANSAERGGGIYMGVTSLGLGIAEAIFERTILWGNCSFADAFGEGYVMTANTLDFSCSHIDYEAMTGSGDIDTLQVTGGLPAFCNFPHSYYSTECDTFRTIAGDFTISTTSPDAPLNSPCFQLIGSEPVVSCLPTAIPETPALPEATILDPPVPNPFNPATTISFSLATKAHVTIKVYDVQGRLVRTLLDKTMPQANHRIKWTGVDDRGRQAASGVYFLRFTAGDVVESRKMVLLK